MTLVCQHGPPLFRTLHFWGNRRERPEVYRCDDKVKVWGLKRTKTSNFCRRGI